MRDDAIAIWKAGVDAVDSMKLVQRSLVLNGSILAVCSNQIELNSIDRLLVVGAGKAGAGMATGVESVLGAEWLNKKKVQGWVNVPNDCVRGLERIVLHGARPAGLNEPTTQGVNGSERILELVQSMNEDDVCLVLISGGGSALMPLPIEGITLDDKLAVTRLLSRSGASIQELNTVRKHLSKIKGGGLLRATPRGRLISLIVSDVIGDPLDIIASGPTVLDQSTAEQALSVLRKYSADCSSGLDDSERDHSPSIPNAVWDALIRNSHEEKTSSLSQATCQNFVIGNNQTAIDAASEFARRLGYEVRQLGSNRIGNAAEVGVELAKQIRELESESPKRSICLIGGGEPVVKLAKTDKPRRGGRNQEVALSACRELWNGPLEGIAILSGGTDGEDGPTDAAGGICDSITVSNGRTQNLDPETFLAINDSYTFLDRTNGLLKTGPTHTNVMDLQVALRKVCPRDSC